MKTIGLIGGMSWESTVSYYQALNLGIKARLGGLHSAKIILNSMDFADIERMQHAGDWRGTAEILIQAARAVECAGADFLMICTNTMHKVAPDIEAATDIPLLHIADATAIQLCADNITRVGLLGTRFTMAEDFYTGRLRDNFGIEVLVPDATAQQTVHDIIYQELCLGEIKSDSRQRYLDIIDQLAQRGAQAVILGCTEIALLVQQSHTPVPLYDTTALHAQAGINRALA